jgi:hypothetical protein
MTTVARKGKAVGVYIGRAYSMMPQSPYANPFHIGKDGTREEVLLKFVIWWYDEAQRELRALARKELPYRTLICWCKPKACHGDIIAGYVNCREIFESPIGVSDVTI